MKMLNEREIGRLKQRYTTDGKRNNKYKGSKKYLSGKTKEG